MLVEASTLDDALQAVFKKVLKSPIRTDSTKDPARELIGSVITLKNPRARLSLAEGRSTLFSCLGETLWYFSGSDRLDFIEYYISNYRTFSDLPPDAVIAPGAYGPRLFAGEPHQIERVLGMLKNKKDTRQAVVQIFDAKDLGKKDVPCTCTLQLFSRSGQLHMMTNMRSNDAYLGLPHDIFAFTMLQELMARHLKLELGRYHHAVGSLHLYDKDESAARAYVKEGYIKGNPMPAMPPGNPWKSFAWLLKNEEHIRTGGREILDEGGSEDYWVDLARLLKIKALVDDKRRKAVVVEMRKMASQVYSENIRRRAKITPADEEDNLLAFAR